MIILFLRKDATEKDTCDVNLTEGWVTQICVVMATDFMNFGPRAAL